MKKIIQLTTILIVFTLLINCSSSRRMTLDFEKNPVNKSDLNNYKLFFKKGKNNIIERTYEEGLLVDSKGKIQNEMKDFVIYLTTELQECIISGDKRILEKEGKFYFQESEIAKRTVIVEGNSIDTELEGNIPDGIVLTLGKNDILLGITSYKKNKIDGLEIKFFPNENIKRFTYYKNGIEEGGKIFYPSGKLKYDWKNVDGMTEHIGYHENGNVMEVITHKDGKFITKKYDKNGVLINTDD